MTQHAQDSRRSEPLAVDYESWWFADRRIWWRDFDVFGHLTAGSFGVVFQDVFSDLMVELWEQAIPAYVGARMDIEFRREVLPTDNPVRIYAHVARVGRSGFDVDLVMRAAGGHVCSVARAAFAAWDIERHRSRALTEAEAEALRSLNERDQGNDRSVDES